MKHTPGNAAADPNQHAVSLRLEWTLMAARRQTIRSIDHCIRGLTNLRPVFGPEAVDPLLEDYRSVLRAITAVGPNALPSAQEMQDCAALMSALEQRLACLMTPAKSTTRANDNHGRPAERDARS